MVERLAKFIIQMVGIATYLVMVLAFYLFLGLFLGNNVLETTVITIFSCAAFSVMVLFLRCSSIDPIDKNSLKNSGTKFSGNSFGRKKSQYAYLSGMIWNLHCLNSQNNLRQVSVLGD
jgi:magnesium-transporting ATPase (P-type)